MSAGALSGLRVVEIGGSQTLYAGKLFADQGADVLLVEPAGGHVSRFQQPLVDTADGPVSTVFAYFNGNKRTVELAPSEGPEAIAELIASADVVLAGGSPPELIGYGIDPESLATERVIVTVTPFGWSGPWRDLAADELVLNALGGMMSLGGYRDGRPLQPPSGLAYTAAGLFAAVAAMSHLVHATPRPGHVDVSIQECVVMALENAAQFWDLERTVRGRSGGTDSQVGRGVYECADGYIYLMLGLSAGSAFWTRFLTWLDDWDIPGREALHGDRWTQREFIESADAKAAFRSVVEPMLRQHTRAELATAARGYGIPLAPVNRVGDLFEDPQLKAREFFVDVPSTDWPGGTVRAPGAPYRLSRTPATTRYAVTGSTGGAGASR